MSAARVDKLTRRLEVSIRDIETLEQHWLTAHVAADAADARDRAVLSPNPDPDSLIQGNGRDRSRRDEGDERDGSGESIESNAIRIRAVLRKELDAFYARCKHELELHVTQHERTLELQDWKFSPTQQQQQQQQQQQYIRGYGYGYGRDAAVDDGSASTRLHVRLRNVRAMRQVLFAFARAFALKTPRQRQQVFRNRWTRMCRGTDVLVKAMLQADSALLDHACAVRAAFSAACRYQWTDLRESWVSNPLLTSDDILCVLRQAAAKFARPDIVEFLLRWRPSLAIESGGTWATDMTKVALDTRIGKYRRGHALDVVLTFDIDRWSQEVMNAIQLSELMSLCPSRDQLRRLLLHSITDYLTREQVFKAALFDVDETVCSFALPVIFEMLNEACNDATNAQMREHLWLTGVTPTTAANVRPAVYFVRSVLSDFAHGFLYQSFLRQRILARIESFEAPPIRQVEWVMFGAMDCREAFFALRFLWNVKLPCNNLVYLEHHSIPNLTRVLFHCVSDNVNGSQFSVAAFESSEWCAGANSDVLVDAMADITAAHPINPWGMQLLGRLAQAKVSALRMESQLLFALGMTCAGGLLCMTAGILALLLL
jgi:hypothetical protein